MRTLILVALLITANVVHGEGNWRSYLSSVGEVLGMQIGAPRSDVESALAKGGFTLTGCARERLVEETCRVHVFTPTWPKVQPTFAATVNEISVTFRDGRLNSIVHILTFEHYERAVATYPDARAALTAAYGTRAERLGRFRRRVLSALWPGASMSDVAQWKSDGMQSSTCLLKLNGGGGLIAVIVTVEEDP